MTSFFKSSSYATSCENAENSVYYTQCGVLTVYVKFLDFHVGIGEFKG